MILPKKDSKKPKESKEPKKTSSPKSKRNSPVYNNNSSSKTISNKSSTSELNSLIIYRKPIIQIRNRYIKDEPIDLKELIRKINIGYKK